MAEYNADAVRLVKPYVDKAIADAIAAALGANGDITDAIGDAITAALGANGDIAEAIAGAVSTHAALTTGVHGLT